MHVRNGTDLGLALEMRFRIWTDLCVNRAAHLDPIRLKFKTSRVMKAFDEFSVWNDLFHSY